MAVEHSVLTGANLHEPKGVAAATVNKVYISNGTGSGTWSKVTANALDTTTTDLIAASAGIFGSKLFHIRDEQVSGTSGDTIPAGSWGTRTLNTVKTNEIAGASLGTNQITLPAGTYWIQARAPAGGIITNGTYVHKAKLYNVTDVTDTIVGSNAMFAATTYSTINTGSSLDSIIEGRFTIAGAKVFELRHRANSSAGNSACSFGVVEVYSDVKIWKVS